MQCIDHRELLVEGTHFIQISSHGTHGEGLHDKISSNKQTALFQTKHFKIAINHLNLSIFSKYLS